MAIVFNNLSGGGSGKNNSFKLVSSSNSADSFVNDGYSYIYIDRALQPNKLYLVEVKLDDYYCMFKLIIKDIWEYGSLSNSSVQPIRTNYSEETWLYNFINFSLYYDPDFLAKGPAIGFEPLNYADMPSQLEDYYSTASVNVYELGGIVNE